MDKVIKFKNGSQIEIIETDGSSFRTQYEVLMTKEDLEMLWYFNEVYANENINS